MSLRCPAAERLALAFAAAAALAACQRETRDFRGPPAPPPAMAAGIGVSSSTFHAGGPRPIRRDPRARIYEANAFHIGEGKRLYDWYNCYGCHAAGGGDIGPPLMDEEWRYGGEIEQIRASILEGRPNGMPSYAGKINDNQAWQLAAYVRALSGNVPKDAPPSRGDEIQSGPPLTQVPATPPKPVDPASAQGTRP